MRLESKICEYLLKEMGEGSESSHPDVRFIPLSQIVGDELAERFVELEKRKEDIHMLSANLQEDYEIWFADLRNRNKEEACSC